MRQPVVLAADLGGTSLRAALISAEGQMLAQAVSPGPMGNVDGAKAEGDPAEWWARYGALAEDLARAAPEAFAHIVAVAVSGATRTQVFLDAAGACVRPAILFSDTRASAEAAELTALAPPDDPESGQINAFHPLARLLWLKRHEPENFSRLAYVVEPKDWLNLCLTGTVAGDAISLARLAASSGVLTSAAGLPEALPPLRAPLSTMGRVRPGLSGCLAQLAGVPVAAMAHDTWAAVLGLGALGQGRAYNLTGTTEVFGAFSPAPVTAEGLMAVDWQDGLHHLGGPSLCGGDTLAWIAGLFAQEGEGTAATLDRLSAAPAAPPLLFLPHLSGERVPFWDSNLRGAFLGLHRSHGPADMARAAMEGVAFLNRLVIERTEAAQGRPVSEIRFGGGGAASPLWAQIKADICNRRFVTVEAAETGLLGGAIACFTMIGTFASLEDGQAALARPARTFRPDPARRAHYDRLYALFLRAEDALRPLSHALAISPPP